MKKILITILLCIVSNAMFAEIASGTCGKNGDNITWSISDDYVLTLSGSGEMKNYTNSSNAPWYDYSSNLIGCSMSEGITSIGDRAFYGCSGLTSITIPSSVTSIGEYAFSGLSITSLTLPNSVTSIGNYAFECCTYLSSINIPSSVTSIGLDAFDYCNGLKSVNITDLSAWCQIKFEWLGNPLYYAKNLILNGQKVTNLIIPSTVTSIGNYTFESCTCIESVTLPNSITSIGDYAFESCTGLKNIYIPNSVKSFGKRAFEKCTGLTSINIPNSVTSIEWCAFNGCTRLTSITIPESCKTIPEYAFNNCTSLKTLILPSTCLALFDNSFAGCSRLDSIWCQAETPPTIYANTFSSSIYSTAVLNVPAGCGEAYKAHDRWKNFTNILAGGEVPETKKCAKPSIAYEDGVLYFTCATPKTNVKHTVTCEDNGSTEGAELALTATYHISAYATRDGYENSDIAYATLVWASATFTTDDETDVKSIQVPSTPLLITQNSGILSVSGIEDEQAITAYSLSGTKLTSAVVTAGSATLDLSSESGNIVILNVNGRSAKILVK